ncbi:MAG: DUF4831 family protein [Bacteroidaceae bacterium]|nr:DUF4831 family protein [Bacteroidaceae bacterium]
MTTEGAIYFLPKTAINITIQIEKSTYTPGDFCKYAERYLRIKDVSPTPSVCYRITAIRQEAVAIADTTKGFAVKFDAKTSATNVRLSDDGILLAINAEPKKVAVRQSFVPSPRPAAINPRQYMSEEILAAGSTAKMAELTAQQITDLRDRRQLLSTGEADNMPQDERQLQLMLNELDSQCQALTNLFTGITLCDTLVHVVTLCPVKELEREVAFRLSRRLGLVDKDDLSGIPYYITLRNLHPVDDIPLPENKKGEGLYANVPGTAELTLQQEDLTLATFQIPMAQFGFVELREASLFKRYNMSLQLHPATGAVITSHTVVNE